MRLLLAEDEKELSNALTAILRHNNYSVDVVYNGLDALDFLMNQDYDGVILDIMMPGMDGIQVLTKIRSQGNMTPVLILTAKSEVDDRVIGLDSGADDYLCKPFSTKELLARIRAVTRRRTETAGAVLTFGDISLDLAAFDMYSAKGSFKLANKEFQMMEMLISNPGQVISIDRFWEKIWGYDSDAEIAVVWVYISNLRKKLAVLSSGTHIRTARNQGYSLEAVK